MVFFDFALDFVFMSTIHTLYESLQFRGYYTTIVLFAPFCSQLPLTRCSNSEIPISWFFFFPEIKERNSRFVQPV